MEKKSLGYILIAAIAIALVVVFFVKAPKNDVSNEEEQVVPTETQNVLTKSDKKVTKNTKEETIDVTYPEFADVPASINNDIKKFIDDEVAMIDDLVAQGMPDSVVTSYSLQIKYEIEQSNADFVSLVFTVGEYTGGAHPNQYFRTFNYNVATGKEVSLADVYPNDAKYFAPLREKIKTSVHDTLATTLKDNGDTETNPDEMLFEDISKLDESAFQHFTFGTDHITFYFSPYDIAPYAAGPIVARVAR